MKKALSILTGVCLIAVVISNVTIGIYKGQQARQEVYETQHSAYEETSEKPEIRKAGQNYNETSKELNVTRLKYVREATTMNLIRARYKANEISSEEYFAALDEFFLGSFEQYFSTRNEYCEREFKEYFDGKR